MTKENPFKGRCMCGNGTVTWIAPEDADGWNQIIEWAQKYKEEHNIE